MVAQVPTVVFTCNKGGVGKSTLSTNTVASYAKRHPDKRILYIDLTFTNSISSYLLGDAEPASMSEALDMMGQVKRRRDRARRQAAYGLPVLCVLLYMLPPSLVLLCAAMTAAYAYYAFYALFSKKLAKVDASILAARSSLFPNLMVLVGGETLARASRDFPWQMAAQEWVPPSDTDLVVIDIDNTLDDYARWAFSIATGLVVPLGLNHFDFERLSVDPRNGALFDFAEQVGNKQLKYKAVIFNRVRLQADLKEGESDPEGYEFKVAKAEAGLRDDLIAKFRSRVGTDFAPCMVREFAGKVISEMHKRRRPICMVDDFDSATAASKNLDMVADRIFE